MNTEQAIEAIERMTADRMVNLAADMYDDYDIEELERKEVNALSIAIAALRAQQEHPNGCRCQCGETDPNFCETCNRIRVEAIREKLERENPKPCEYCESHSDWDVYWVYCPMCGRQINPKEEQQGE